MNYRKIADTEYITLDRDDLRQYLEVLDTTDVEDIYYFRPVMENTKIWVGVTKMVRAAKENVPTDTDQS